MAALLCPGQDLNLHDVTRCHLKAVRLPIPPPGRRRYRTRGIIRRSVGVSRGFEGECCMRLEAVVLATMVLSGLLIREAAASTPPATAPAPNDLRVMSFNIRYANAK